MSIKRQVNGNLKLFYNFFCIDVESKLLPVALTIYTYIRQTLSNVFPCVSQIHCEQEFANFGNFYGGLMEPVVFSVDTNIMTQMTC